MNEPRVTYDSEADALIVVNDESPVARTLEVAGGRNVDFDDVGNVVAIEIPAVSAGVALDDLAEQYNLHDEVRRVERFLPKQFYKHYA